MCQQNLDLRQSQINAAMGTSFNIPVLYFSQIIGLAYGFSPKELGIDKNMVSAESLIQSRRPVGGRQNGTAAG
jgi:heterodisulfide reductase subunit B